MVKKYGGDVCQAYQRVVVGSAFQCVLLIFVIFLSVFMVAGSIRHMTFVIGGGGGRYDVTDALPQPEETKTTHEQAPTNLHAA